MFNDDQKDWMKHLSELPPEKKCKCGWNHFGDCENCIPVEGGRLNCNELAPGFVDRPWNRCNRKLGHDGIHSADGITNEMSPGYRSVDCVEWMP